jgi:hypothetical protein
MNSERSLDGTRRDPDISTGRRLPRRTRVRGLRNDGSTGWSVHADHNQRHEQRLLEQPSAIDAKRLVADELPGRSLREALGGHRHGIVRSARRRRKRDRWRRCRPCRKHSSATAIRSKPAACGGGAGATMQRIAIGGASDHELSPLSPAVSFIFGQVGVYPRGGWGLRLGWSCARAFPSSPAVKATS